MEMEVLILKIQTTDEEKKFRKKKFPNIKSLFEEKIRCTTCGKDLMEKLRNKSRVVRIHPILDVLWCRKCEKFYGDGEFSADEEDGRQKYCRWCGQGGSLYCCNNCPEVFCKICVRRNFKRKFAQEVMENHDWKCFMCVNRPLWPLRAICNAAKRILGTNESSSGPSATAPINDNLSSMAERNDDANEKSMISNNDSLAVNVSSIIESLNSSEENHLINLEFLRD